MNYLKSIRGKLLLTFLAVTVVPLAVATGVSVVRFRGAMEHRTGEDRALVANQVANWLDRIVYERALDVQQLGSSSELVMATMGMADPASVRAMLADVTERSRLFASVLVYDATGNLIAASSDRAFADAEANAAGVDWFKAGAAPNTPTFLGAVHRGPEGRLRVRIADAIRTLNGDNVGVVAADLDWGEASGTVLRYLEDYFARAGSEGVRAYIVDPQGIVIGATAAEGVLSRSIAGSAALAALAEGETGSAVEALFGSEDLLVGYGTLNNAGDTTGWYRGYLDGRAGILVTQSAQEAFAEANHLMMFLILLALGAAAVVAWIAWTVTHRLADPLARTVEMIQRMSRGNLSHRLRIDREDEIGVLARTMDEFADSLQRHVLGVLHRFADGDLAYDRSRSSEEDEIAVPLERISSSLQGLVAETGRLTSAAQEGRLEVRGDAGRFQGGYRDLVEGINATLDAVVEPINEAAVVLERVAARDLTARMEGRYQGDFQKIKTSLNAAVENLEQALSEVAQSAEQVASASGQISSGSQTLASGANEQASSLEEVSSSLQELFATVKTTAANAAEVRELMRVVGGEMQTSMGSMERLTQAMQEIQGSADQTAKIIKTIDEIAFQTNLLALNAAVEAARAGEAGKGFAVVAEEVRGLAMRSAEAAKQTAEIIEGSIKTVKQGGGLNAEAFAGFTRIGEHAKRHVVLAEEIAAATQQQSQGVEQINAAVEQMNTVTQQTAASSEESASAAEELWGQAEKMRGMIREFQLSRVARATAPSRGAGRAEEPARPNGRSGAKRVPALAHGTAATHGNGHGRVDPGRLIPFDDDEEVLREF